MLIHRQLAVRGTSLDLFHHLHKIDVTKSWVDKNRLSQIMGRAEGKLLILIKFIETFCIWNEQYKQLICGVQT